MTFGVFWGTCLQIPPQKDPFLLGLRAWRAQRLLLNGRSGGNNIPPIFFLDAAFLLTIGSFLLAVELFLLTIDNCSFLTYSWSCILTALASLLTVGAFFAYSGKVHLRRALRDCKQRSLTVSKAAPTVSKKASPFSFLGRWGAR